MQDTIITWNLENWVTIVLMAGLGFALVGLVMGVIKRRQGTPATFGGGQSAQ